MPGFSLQALGMFSAALASGQLGPLMCQFGLPAEAVEAANKGGKCPLLRPQPRQNLFSFCGRGKSSPLCPAQGWRPRGLGSAPRGPGPGRCLCCVADVGAFAEAMQNSAGSEQKEGDGKDKKDEEEDMSLD